MSKPNIAGYLRLKRSESCMIQSIGLMATADTLIVRCPAGGSAKGAFEMTRGRLLGASAHAATFLGDANGDDMICLLVSRCHRSEELLTRMEVCHHT